ncbi:MAG TPA: SIMPL domain-containing protein [Mycobacteriales bacterium]|nr:SIMPL domain-containing protein [Mycobacteriales bacterium]
MNRTASRAGVISIALLSVLTAAVAVGVIADSGGGTAVASTSATKTISVSGLGTVQGVPDTLVANLSVHTRQSSVQDALNDAATDMRQVESTLVNKGVHRSELQTTDLELNPAYDNHGHVIGYDASESLSVSIQPLSNVGTILSAVAGSAGNSVTIDGLSLDISDDSSLINDARAKAFAQAKDAAEQDASLAGEHLGDVVSIKESEESTTPPQPFYDSVATSAKAASVPISAGKQPVSVTLDVVWSID